MPELKLSYNHATGMIEVTLPDFAGHRAFSRDNSIQLYDYLWEYYSKITKRYKAGKLSKAELRRMSPEIEDFLRKKKEAEVSSAIDNMSPEEARGLLELLTARHKNIGN